MSIYNKIEELENLGVTNPYLRLGVRENATTEEIIKAYRDAVKKIGIHQNQQTDNNYVIQILKAIKDALINPDIRAEIDRVIAKEKQGYEIAVQRKEGEDSETSEEISKNSKQDLDIQEIMEFYGLNKNKELSCAELQLILRDYIKRNLDFSKTSPSNRIELRDIYLLLEMNGLLHCVREEKDTSGNRCLLDIFDNTQRAQSKSYYYIYLGRDVDALDYWGNHYRNIKDKTRLVSLTSILSQEFFERDLGRPYPYIQQKILQQGIELGNECLLKLRKNGYLKPISPNEYIK